MACATAAGVVVVLLVGEARPAHTQPPRATPTTASRVRFTGAVRLQAAGRTDSVRVDVRVWSLAPGVRLDSLALPLRGLVIVELRGGAVTTVIDGREQERNVGELWVIPAGRTMRFQTGRDMATLQTTVVQGP